MSEPNNPDDRYGIRAVSQLTGISLETLRAWERRYDLVAPERGSSKRRLYTVEDVERLKQIKQLVDRGHAISTVASLSAPELQARLRQHEETRAEEKEHPASVRGYFVGEALPYLVDGWREQLPGISMVGSCQRLDELEAMTFTNTPDVLVVECAALDIDTPPRLREIARRARIDRVVVAYGFATTRALEQMRQYGFVTVRTPITADALHEACLVGIRPSGSPQRTRGRPTTEASVPQRRFDGRTLAAIAKMPSRLRCECPHHLADLLFRLNAFETYSAQCESRNAQDAALHARLRHSAAQARAILENGLEHLIRCENIDLSVYS